ncbi:MAG: hypothetical protein AB8B59_09460 [Maribacter sp.]
MKARSSLLLLSLFLFSALSIAQKSVDIDGRLQPILDEFFEECQKYNIDYHDKLFQLSTIDISNSLPLEEGNTVLGMVARDSDGNVKDIVINWAAMLDPEILKVVAFHEFAHHFLDYKHTCQDCNEIMAVTNTSYFDLANDWENQVQNLFITSPVYLAQETKEPVASMSLQ